MIPWSSKILPPESWIWSCPISMTPRLPAVTEPGAMTFAVVWALQVPAEQLTGMGNGSGITVPEQFGAAVHNPLGVSSWFFASVICIALPTVDGPVASGIVATPVIDPVKAGPVGV